MTEKPSGKAVRMERDALGEIAVPAAALWGAQTQRAIENFPISGERFGRRFIAALGQVKRACAQANLDLGALADDVGEAMLRACDEVIAGTLDAHFPVDVFQTGSGTSSNMNANEVIANRAIQLLGGAVGTKTPVHPNDHVNHSQSSNDVFPTAIHVAVAGGVRDALIPALATLRAALLDRAQAFQTIVKIGRTHLQDATPIRLGQEFAGYAEQVAQAIARSEHAMELLRPLPLGGTAVGTGVNCPPGFAARAIAHLNVALGTQFVEAENHVWANAAREGLVDVSGALRATAVGLAKIANDIRWLGSGPRGGLGELRLPVVQPGSSIMPGKANPVMAEALLMATAQVIGYDAAIALGGLGANFELNTMMPLLAHNLIRSLELLSNAIRAFADRCVAGLEVNAARCREVVEGSAMLATALAPLVGYDVAVAIARTAHAEGRSVREIALERGAATARQLDALLDPQKMTGA